MRYSILIALVIYMVIVIVGVGTFLARRQRAHALESGSFILSNRDLPMPVVACTLGLTVLGAIHVLGLFEMSYGIGAVSQWVSFAHVILLIVVCLVTGRFARQLGVSSIPELIGRLFGPTTRIMVACVMAGGVFGIITLETQGFGILLNSITGWPIGQASVVGAIFGVLYVILGGMKEIAWVNLINTVVMYVGLVVAAVYLAMVLPGGWDGVESYYFNSPDSWKLSIWGTPDGALFIGFGLAFVFSTTFFQGCSQMCLQPALSAKDADTVKKALWIAAPVNGLFGVFTIAIGMASVPWALANPQIFGDMAPAMVAKAAAPTMLVNILPTWLVMWLLASFAATVLSSFAVICLAVSTIFTLDIYKNYFNPDLTPAGERRMVRVVIVLVAAYGCLIAQSMPELVRGLNWLFAWLSPVFLLVILGLFWRRSAKGAFVTLTATWIVNLLWSFTPLADRLATTGVVWLDSALLNNVYPCIIVSLILILSTHTMMPSEPGLLRRKKLAANDGNPQEV